MGLVAAAGLPAFAISSPEGIELNANRTAEIQAFDASSDVATQVVERAPYAVSTAAELLAAKWTAEVPRYAVDWAGPIRWPFPIAVPVSDGFGWRTSPCSGCSSNHKGVDFLGGDGRPMYAVAEGVVRERTEEGGFGNHAYIESTIDGQAVEVLYAHMQSGSSPLNAGDLVSPGDFVGLVGSTGQTTGPHLHLELSVEGQKVDPYAWLSARTL